MTMAGVGVARARERHHHDARHRESLKRPPARPAGSGPRKMLHPSSTGGKNLKNPALPASREVSAIGARGGGGAGCAGSR